MEMNRALRSLSISLEQLLSQTKNTHVFFKTMRSIVLIALEMLYQFQKCSQSMKIKSKKPHHHGRILLQSLQYCLFLAQVSTSSISSLIFKFRTVTVQSCPTIGERTHAHRDPMQHIQCINSVVKVSKKQTNKQTNKHSGCIIALPRTGFLFNAMCSAETMFQP